MAEINDKNKRSLNDIYSATSSFNANNTQIQQALQNINTMFLGVITAVNAGGTGGSKTVSAKPLIASIDANGNKQSTVSYVELPYYRVQAGVAGLIVDPVVGDIGVFICSKRDISNIKNGVADSQVPASFRSFDLADAVMVATIHTGTPTTYIKINQDGTIEVKAPSSMTITAPTVTINGNVKVNGTVTATGDIKGGSVVLQTHVHGNVKAGSDNTSAPV